jgi:dTDP-3-amino-3,4,6-trideoxy-alpha-D-glucose transaminase
MVDFAQVSTRIGGMKLLTEQATGSPPTELAARSQAHPSGHRVPFAALDREHAELAEELHEAFDRVMRRSAFVLGEEVERFEQDWAATCQTAECIGVSSGTAALALLLRAAGIGSGDEVIVPAHTYIASALGVVHAGAVPVLCDVEDGTGLLDVDAAAAVIGPRTAAILAVHLYGQLCDMRAVERVASSRGLAVFEDAAQAHGAECDGKHAGGFGKGAAFSFYPSKNLGALGDAGAICTNDAALAERARRLRNLGQRHKGEHLIAGSNDRLDGLQAALLSVKLRRLAAANTARRRHAVLYRSLLGQRVRGLEERPETSCVYHLFPVRVPHRQRVAARLEAQGVATGVHYPLPLSRQPALRDLAVVRDELPRSEAWAREELSLPMSPKLDADEIAVAAHACAAAVADIGDGGSQGGRA